MKNSKLTPLMLGAALCLVFASCKDADAPLTMEGAVIAASMNTILLRADNGDTVWFSTMNSNREKVPGVLLGDSVRITYVKEDVNGTTDLMPTELVITVHSPYYFIQGTWVEPNPINAAQIQGFTLNPDGTASSVNMATLEFTAWNMDGDTLYLSAKSIGSGQTIEATDTLMVNKINADSLILSDNGNVVWRMARQN